MIRCAIIISLAALALTGCASKPKPQADAKPARQISVTTVPPEAPPKTRILPFNGRIARVVDKLRIVVVDFTNSPKPELDQRLSVYRVGQKVGEIKVSGPFLNTTVAADLVAGEAKYGDEVRVE